jgi:hypothetical protein
MLLKVFRPMWFMPWTKWAIQKRVIVSKRYVTSQVRILSRKSIFGFRESG